MHPSTQGNNNYHSRLVTLRLRKVDSHNIINDNNIIMGFNIGDKTKTKTDNRLALFIYWFR